MIQVYPYMRVPFIVSYSSQRYRSQLAQSPVLPPLLLPWIKVLHGTDEGSCLSLTGISRRAFATLRDTVFGREAEFRKQGRVQPLDNSGQLGLLFYH